MAYSEDDIAFGRAALQRGWVSRPQLDGALALLQSGSVPDLGQAMLQQSLLSPQQVAELRGGAPGGWSEADTLHGKPPGPPAPGGSAWTEAPTLHGKPPSPPGSAFPQGPGSAFPQGPGSAFPQGPGSAFPQGPGSAFPQGPGSAFPQGPGSAFPQGPGSAFPPGSAPGGPGSAFGAGSGSGFGGGFSGPGSAFGTEDVTLAGGPLPPPGEHATLHDHQAPGSNLGSGAFGAGGTGFGSGAFGSGAFGSGTPAPFGSGPGSAPGGMFGAPPSGSGVPFGGTGLGSGPGSAFGSGPGGSAFGSGPGGSAFGSGPGGSAFGSGPGGSGFGSGAFGSAVEEEDAEIGDWTVERELARGNMGVVYLGSREQNGVKERGAIKVLLTSSGAISEKQLKRFLREIESTRQLEHANIVKILDSGEFRGFPFFAMEFVEGKPLDRMLKDDLDLEIGMEILEKVARAAQFAHDQGIIHRDLKPANVIVRDDMEPKLTDFGLAKNRDHKSILTNTGAVLGTPYYLSPEQASGRSSSLDERADVYSLGVIMYELATGRLPFVGNTTVELYNRIIHDEPVPPSKIKPQLTKALETVCLTAMAKEPDDRYPTATAFADDIAALLQGGQIKAKQDNKITRWAKRVRRRGSLPLVIGGTAVSLFAVLGGLVYRYKQNTTEIKQGAQEDQFAKVKRTVDESLDEARSRCADARKMIAAGALPDALQATQDAFEKLEKLDELEKKLEEDPDVGERIKEHLAERQAQGEGVLSARIAAYVLRATATMLGDEDGAQEKAQQDLDKVLDPKAGLKADDAVAMITQAELLVLKGSLKDAVQQFEAASKRMPNSVRAAYGLAGVQIRQERYNDAISSLTRGLDLLDTDPKELERQQSKDEAVELESLSADERASLRELLLVDRARARLYQVERLDSDTHRKITSDLDAAAKLGRTRWPVLSTQGQVFTRRGMLFHAIERFDKAVQAASELGPKPKAAALCAKADGLLALGEPAAAERTAREAVATDPDSLLGLELRAEAFEDMLLPGEAKKLASAVVSRAQKRHWQIHARALRVLARLEGARGNVNLARKEAKKGVGLDEYGTKGRLLLARLELNPHFDGQYLVSVDELLKDVLKLHSDSARARLLQGLLMQQKFANDPARARRKLLEAVEQDPRNPWALSLLAQVLAETGKKAESKDDALRAKREWAKAYRYERDVRNLAGVAYAAGLRLEREARAIPSGRARAKERAAKIEAATLAYQYATWICPTHTHALTGLTNLALLQSVHKGAGEYLKRAGENNPDSVYVSVLRAFHLASPRGVQEQPTEATKALKEALERRGPILALRLREVFVEELAGEMKHGQEDDVNERVARITKRYGELRAQDPLEREIVRNELALLTRLKDSARMNRRDYTENKRVRFNAYSARLSQVEKELSTLEDRIKTGKAEAAKKIKRARKQLDKGGPLRALGPAAEACRLDPFSGENWRTLALARDKAGDLWGALSAGMVAASNDDNYLKELFELLRRAGNEPKEEGASKIIEHLKNDEQIYPIDPDLKRLMTAAPLVARALVIELGDDDEVKATFRKKAIETFKQLEDIMNHDPTNLLSHAMVGALAFGVRRDDYAVQHLLFLAEVKQDLGEAFYLAAVASARRSGSRDRSDVIAIRSLQRATRAGFAWEELSQGEAAIDRLRNSKLWPHVGEDLLAVDEDKQK